MKTAASAATENSSILLVDDNNHGLIARKAVLEEIGYKVSTARSAEEALEICATQRFDVVVTDYKMDKMNGVELIKDIRKSDSKACIIFNLSVSSMLLPTWPPI